MEDKLLEELNKFKEKVDEIFVGQTPKLPEDVDADYDCDVYLFRHPGMGNSKQIISGNPVSLATVTASYLETLLRQGIFDESQITTITYMAIRAASGELEDDKDE